MMKQIEQTLAARLVSCRPLTKVRAESIIDEFCMILPCKEIAAARMLCERFIAYFDSIAREPMHFSFGICQTGPAEFTDTDSVLKTADELMYGAKAKSRAAPGSKIECQIVKHGGAGEPAAA